MCGRRCGEGNTGRCLVRTDDASVRAILRMARRKPAMRLLTAGIDSEFARVLKDKRVQRVDIATAWATKGPGLDALERAVKQREVRVRALVGIAGGHTTPDALKRLCKLGKVRLVEGNGLFHVKLYLFHRVSTSSAWIGSANFTGPGFEKNEEVLIQTTNATEAVDWFKSRWKKVDADRSRRRLKEYCKTWKPPSTPPPDDVDELAYRSDDDDDKIVFVQEGERPTPLVEGDVRGTPPHGSVRVANNSFRYESAQQAAKMVFDELQRRDENFLRKCWNDVRFHGRKNHFISNNKEGLGTAAFRQHPMEIGDGWWMSTQIQTQKKWELVKWAAEIAGLHIEVRGEYWEAESKSRVEVGF